MGLGRAAEALEQAARPDERETFAAFARGNQLFIDTQSQPPASRILATELRSASWDRSRFHAGRLGNVPHAYQ